MPHVSACSLNTCTGCHTSALSSSLSAGAPLVRRAAARKRWSSSSSSTAPTPTSVAPSSVWCAVSGTFSLADRRAGLETLVCRENIGDAVGGERLPPAPCAWPCPGARLVEAAED